jgi:histidinol-phosphate aminotransferase
VIVHGGPDALGVPLHDFSTNANACGPCPSALAAVQAADARLYPDPAYTVLRRRLAARHGVAPARVLLAASASEFIGRISTWAALQGVKAAAVPPLAYGDYAQAARTRGLAVVPQDDASAGLAWACDPISPTGQRDAGLPQRVAAWPAGRPFVLDCAYEPLRLSGMSALTPDVRDRTWQLWSPNKALGLTGVRGAYAIAPADASPACRAAVDALAPSWPLGAHAVAMLTAWTEPATHRWLATTRATLAEWAVRQRTLCAELGWQVPPSDASFFCARLPDAAAMHARVARLRTQGIKLRDCASFGLAGHVRLRVMPPASQDALADAWRLV